MDVTAYGVQVRFQGEMTGWEQMDFGIGQIAREGVSTVRPEDLVALTPDGRQWHLAGAEVLVELRFTLDVRRVVPEERQLHLVVARPVQQVWSCSQLSGLTGLGSSAPFSYCQRVVSALNFARAPGSVSGPGPGDVAYENRSSQKRLAKLSM